MRSPTAGEGVLFKGCMVLKTGRGQEVYEQGVTIATREHGCTRHHSAVFAKCSIVNFISYMQYHNLGNIENESPCGVQTGAYRNNAVEHIAPQSQQ